MRILGLLGAGFLGGTICSSPPTFNVVYVLAGTLAAELAYIGILATIGEATRLVLEGLRATLR